MGKALFFTFRSNFFSFGKKKKKKKKKENTINNIMLFSVL